MMFRTVHSGEYSRSGSSFGVNRKHLEQGGRRLVRSHTGKSIDTRGKWQAQNLVEEIKPIRELVSAPVKGSASLS